MYTLLHVQMHAKRLANTDTRYTAGMEWEEEAAVTDIKIYDDHCAMILLFVFLLFLSACVLCQCQFTCASILIGFCFACFGSCWENWNQPVGKILFMIDIFDHESYRWQNWMIDSFLMLLHDNNDDVIISSQDGCKGSLEEEDVFNCDNG